MSGHGYKSLASGSLVDVDDNGRAELMRCPWAVQVPSDNPEPDCEADCWTTIDCGASMRDGGYGDDTIACEYGHEFGGLERRLAPYGSEWRLEQEDRFAETGSYVS